MGIDRYRQTNDWWGPKQNECQRVYLRYLRGKRFYFVSGVTGGGKELPRDVAMIRRLAKLYRL
jgi:hypothetical protein